MPPRARWALAALAAALVGAAALVLVRAVLRPGGAPSAAAAIARLSTALGEVSTRRAGTFAFLPASAGDPLQAGDSVRTAEGSRAVVTYASGAQVHVDPSSLVVVVPQEDAAVRSLRLESGAVAGEIPPGPGQPGRVSVSDPAGAPVASIARLDPEQQLSFRVRLREEAAAEVSILRGDAEVSRRGRPVRLRSGQAIELPSSGDPGEPIPLPAYPELRDPVVDAQVELADVPSGAVRLRWDPSRRAAAFRVQVALQAGEGFDFTSALAVDRVIPELELDFVPPRPGTYAWRVAGVDARGREGEAGFARRFVVRSVRATPSGGEDSIDGVQAQLAGALFTRGEKAPAALLFGPELDLDARPEGSVEVQGTKLLLGSEGKLRVIALRREGERLRTAVVLDAGSLVADLAADAALQLVQVRAGEAAVGLASGSRGGVELRAGLTRVTCERGEVEVSGAGRSFRLAAGEAVDVGADGPGAPMTVPDAPAPMSPASGALVAPGPVRFAWHPVPRAARYHLSVTQAGGATAHDEVIPGTTAQAKLAAGSYSWSVTSIDEAGLRSPARARPFTVGASSAGPPPRPPRLAIVSPAAGASVTVDYVDLVGQTVPGASVQVNTRPVDVDPAGLFRARVPLQLGPNSIDVFAKDSTGRSSSASIHVRREVP